MKAIRLLITSFILCCILPLHAEYFQRIGMNEGLNQPSVMSISQDKLGRMWFGTLEGLNIFDGESVKSYKGWVQSADSLLWLGNQIYKIFPDKSGDMYFISDFNLMRYDIKKETFHRMSDDEKTYGLTTYDDEVWYFRNDTVFTINPDTQESTYKVATERDLLVNDLMVTDNRIYIAHRKGLNMVNRDNGEVTKFLDGIDVQYLFISSKKNVWIGTRMDGMFWIDPEDTMRQIPRTDEASKGLKSTQIRQFVEDDDNNIWFGTFDGLYKYDNSTEEYKLIRIPERMGGLTHSSIYSLYKDKQGIIWVGTFWGGVNYFDPRDNEYLFYSYDLGSDENLYYSYIGDMILDKDNHLWIATDGAGVTCMNDKWEILHRFTAGHKNSILHNNVKDIAYDEENNALYIGTYLGGLSRYDLKTGKFFNYLTDYHKSTVCPGEIINFVKLINGKLYTLGSNGIYALDIATQNFKHISIPEGYVNGFDVDQNNNIYVLGWNSFAYFNEDNPEDVTHVSLESYGCKSSLTKILTRGYGVIICSLGSGVFHYNLATQKMTQYTKEAGQLLSNYCYNVCLTSELNLLISTDKGITYYNPREDRFSTIDFSNYFPNTHIIHDCGLFSGALNTVFVGTTEGLVTFKEYKFHKVKEQAYAPDFYFSSLEVESQPIVPNDATGILAEGMPFTKKISLESYQQNATIRFATSDYQVNLTGATFRYKLEGMEENWTETTERKISYAGLQPGNYTLRVALLDGQKVVKEIKLQIHVATPWYNTWWAWMVYLLVIGLTTRLVVKNKIAKRELAMKLDNERKEKEHIEQLNHEKLVFFTNVSHEFRTPLTLLLSHVDILLQKHNFGPTIYNQILKIKKNGEQMNNLITELLEFRKLTQKHRKLQVSHQDMGAFLKEAFIPFVDYAMQRNITFENHFPKESVICTFDASLMVKVVLNLLSNAFKFTENGGRIILSGKVTADEVEFSVEDTGSGLSERDVSQIFNRFYQGNNQQKSKELSPGTGIGLALSKAIVESHHGEIFVESTVDKGSTFTVRLKRSLEAYRDDPQIEFVELTQEKLFLIDSVPMVLDSQLKSPEEMIGKSSDEQSAEREEIGVKTTDADNSQTETTAEDAVTDASYVASTDTSAVASTNASVDTSDDKKRTVLLVEDNIELLQILKDLFSPFYKVFTATNGEEGLQKVYSESVELIVSDIMMPKMSGTEMCLQLKNNIDYCHIPIILLTALDSTEKNIEGLSRGADDYVTKPFHAGLLLARANNLIRSRLLIQHQFDKRPMSEIDLTSINPLDQELLKKVTSIIEAHIDDPQFDIPVLCQELGVSRSLIYAKFKALTGMTPNNFLLNFRLKYAATLLQQYKDIMISEVSDRTGFNSAVYFSQCFKKQYGVTPHVYKKENCKNN